ncbi:MAG: hypothetical protein AABZ67_03190 [Pseudomonadota bacterium]
MPDDTKLSAEAADFLRTLEGSDYPKALVESYPRIVNAVVELRDDRVELKKYLDTLLNDVRGGRKGFSLSILMNIQDLRDRLVGPEPDTDGVSKWL